MLSVCLSVIKTPQTAKNQSFHRTTNAHYNLHHPHLHPHHNHRHHYPSIILILSFLQQSLNFILPTITIIILPSSSFHHLQISTLFQQSFTFILTTITLIILPSSIHYPPTIQQSLTFLLTTITIIILHHHHHHHMGGQGTIGCNFDFLYFFGFITTCYVYYEPNISLYIVFGPFTGI